MTATTAYSAMVTFFLAAIAGFAAADTGVTGIYRKVTQANTGACADGDDSTCATSLTGLECGHGAGGGVDAPIGGDADAADDVLYPYVCCEKMFTKTDEWCEHFVENGYRVKYEAQCRSQRVAEDEAGNMWCVQGALEGERCADDGDDKTCQMGFTCAHGSGGTSGDGGTYPLGGDPDGEDKTLFPYRCFAQGEAITDDWCVWCVPEGGRAKHARQCALGTYAFDNDDGTFTCTAAEEPALIRCDDNGDDASCKIGGPASSAVSCVHGPGGTAGVGGTFPLGGDAEAGDEVLYPYVCWSSRSVLTASDEWCIGCDIC